MASLNQLPERGLPLPQDGEDLDEDLEDLEDDEEMSSPLERTDKLTFAPSSSSSATSRRHSAPNPTRRSSKDSLPPPLGGAKNEFPSEGNVRAKNVVDW